MYSDKEIIESFQNGDNGPFSWFFVTTVEKLVKHLRIKEHTDGKSSSNMRYRKDSEYMSDIIQDCFAKLTVLIKNKDFFMQGDQIMKKNGQGTYSLLTWCKKFLDNRILELNKENEKYVTRSVGDNEDRSLNTGCDNTFKEETSRLAISYADTESIGSDDESQIGSDDESQIGSDDESQIGSDGESQIGSDGESQIITDDESQDGHIDLSILISEDDNKSEEEELLRLMEEMLKNMGEPCRTILKKTHFQLPKKLPDDQIAIITGLKNANTVKSTRQRCEKTYKGMVLQEAAKRGMIEKDSTQGHPEKDNLRQDNIIDKDNDSEDFLKETLRDALFVHNSIKKAHNSFISSLKEDLAKFSGSIRYLKSDLVCRHKDLKAIDHYQPMTLSDQKSMSLSDRQFLSDFHSLTKLVLDYKSLKKDLIQLSEEFNDKFYVASIFGDETMISHFEQEKNNLEELFSEHESDMKHIDELLQQYEPRAAAINSKLNDKPTNSIKEARTWDMIRNNAFGRYLAAAAVLFFIVLGTWRYDVSRTHEAGEFGLTELASARGIDDIQALVHADKFEDAIKLLDDELGRPFTADAYPEESRAQAQHDYDVNRQDLLLKKASILLMQGKKSEAKRILRDLDTPEAERILDKLFLPW